LVLRKETDMTSKKKKRNVTADDGQAKSKNQSYCGLGLCRKTTNLTETECCNNWICDDEDQYVSFSYARNSCFRNHRRYTLCGYHHAEGHSGHWKECSQCREDTETEMYVYYGTNEYNFEKLENPPDYEPTKCQVWGRNQTRCRRLHTKRRRVLVRSVRCKRAGKDDAPNQGIQPKP